MERLLAHADGSALTVGDQAVAGAGAGVAVSFLAAPTELIKCRLQSQLTTAQAAGVSTAGVLAPCGTPVFRNVARPGVRPSRFAAAATAAVAAAPSVSPALAGVGGGLHGASGDERRPLWERHRQRRRQQSQRRPAPDRCRGSLHVGDFLRSAFRGSLFPPPAELQGPHRRR
jgi:hypothetical protein